MSVCRGARDLTFQYPCSYRFPLLAGGTKSRFPSRSGGNLQEGGKKGERAKRVGVDPFSPRPSPPFVRGERAKGVGGFHQPLRTRST